MKHLLGIFLTLLTVFVLLAEAGRTPVYRRSSAPIARSRSSRSSLPDECDPDTCSKCSDLPIGCDCATCVATEPPPPPPTTLPPPDESSKKGATIGGAAAGAAVLMAASGLAARRLAQPPRPIDAAFEADEEAGAEEAARDAAARQESADFAG